MKALSEFQFEGNDIRVVTKNGEPWFVAKDVCDVLDIQNVAQAIENLESDEKLLYTIDISGQGRKIAIISESGLYSLIFTSRKSEAKAFRKWVTSEVLPALRKTGSYSVPTDIRDKSKTVRNAFTRCLVEHGVNKPHEFIQLTYAHKENLQIPREKKKDNYDSQELLLTTAAEMVTQWHVENKSLNGYHAIKPQAQMSAQAIFETTIGLAAIAEKFTNQLEAVKA